MTLKLERRLLEDSNGRVLDEDQLKRLRKDALRDYDDWLSVVEWTGEDSIYSVFTIST